MARGFPSMTALLGLLAIAGYQNRDKLGELLKNATSANNAGGLGGLLGGLAGSGGVGGLLNGGLGELLERFRQNGQGEAADSWVSRGPNREITRDELRSAIGADVLSRLQTQTGLSEDELLNRLTRELPAAVDQYTPDGRVPDQTDIADSRSR